MDITKVNHVFCSLLSRNIDYVICKGTIYVCVTDIKPDFNDLSLLSFYYVKIKTKIFVSLAELVILREIFTEIAVLKLIDFFTTDFHNAKKFSSYILKYNEKDILIRMRYNKFVEVKFLEYCMSLGIKKSEIKPIHNNSSWFTFSELNNIKSQYPLIDSDFRNFHEFISFDVVPYIDVL